LTVDALESSFDRRARGSAVNHRNLHLHLVQEFGSMRKFAASVVNFLQREDGPTAVEYAVMLALIIVVCITAITAIGTNANKTFSNVASNLTSAT
jgi:pilus assembly protein Flp/PilA